MLNLSQTFVFSLQSGEKGVLDGIRVIGEAISRKQTSLLALTSIVEVKVETALISEEKASNKYLIVFICFIIIAIGAAAVFSILYMRHKKSLGMSGINLSPSADSCHRNHEDEKSNNLQNEENLRRYTNPLKDDIGSMGSINSTGASSMDIPKVSVVRPLSSMIPMESSSEMLEMISEVDCPGSRKTMLVMPGTSSDTNSIKGDGLSPAHRSSQIMLYKAQNPDVRKNTAAFDDSSGHKDFSKSIINVNNKRTSQNTPQNSSDILTVLV